MDWRWRRRQRPLPRQHKKQQLLCRFTPNRSRSSLKNWKRRRKRVLI
jgi:hypothetical protein